MTKRVTVDGVSSNVVVSFCAFSLAQVSDLHRLNKIVPQESWLGEGALCKAAQKQWLCLIQTNLILSPLSNADFIIMKPNDETPTVYVCILFNAEVSPRSNLW